LKDINFDYKMMGTYISTYISNSPIKSFFLGIFLLFVLFRVYVNFRVYMAWVLYGMKPLTGMDKIFYANETESIMTMYLQTEEFDFKTMKAYMLKKTPDWFRLKGKIVEYNGHPYYQDMTTEEWNKKKDEVFIEVNDVHTEKELQDWMTKVMKTSIDLFSNVSYRWYLIPKYKNNEGRIVIAFNHCMFDGVSCAMFVNALTTNPDILKFPVVSRLPSWIESMVQTILFPYYFVKISSIAAGFEKLKYDTPWRNFSEPTMDRTVRIIENLKLEPIKVQCRKHKISVNFFMHALLSQTIKEYIKRHGDDKTDRVVINSTFSLRDFPRDGSLLEMKNDFVSQTYELPLLEDLNKAVAASKGLVHQLVFGGGIGVNKVMCGLLGRLPSAALKPAFSDACVPITMLYSNMPSPE
jgi:hypothetical protein